MLIYKANIMHYLPPVSHATVLPPPYYTTREMQCTIITIPDWMPFYREPEPYSQEPDLFRRSQSRLTFLEGAKAGSPPLLSSLLHRYRSIWYQKWSQIRSTFKSCSYKSFFLGIVRNLFYISQKILTAFRYFS